MMKDFINRIKTEAEKNNKKFLTDFMEELLKTRNNLDRGEKTKDVQELKSMIDDMFISCSIIAATDTNGECSLSEEDILKLYETLKA